jgi:hypothetical protein
MAKIFLKNKLWLIISFCFLLSLSTVNAFAWGGHGEHGERYHYRGGRWYSPGWFGFDIAVSALTIGALVEGLPAGYTTVVAGGTPYYYYGGYYYRHYPYGYVVVPEPVITPNVVYTPAPEVTSTTVIQPQGSTATTINIPNLKGGYTPVALTKYKNGYLGPQGEYYEGHPTVEQLKALYGN